MKWFKGIRWRIIDHFYQQSRIWGVSWPSEKPPEFIITNHAEERLQQRLSGKKKEKERMIVAAWFSKELVPQDFINYRERIERQKPNVDKNTTRYYRKFDRMIWIFTKSYMPKYQMTQKVLITVFEDTSL